MKRLQVKGLESWVGGEERRLSTHVVCKQGCAETTELNYSMDRKKGLVSKFKLPRPSTENSKRQESLVSLKGSIWGGGVAHELKQPGSWRAERGGVSLGTSIATWACYRFVCVLRELVDCGADKRGNGFS